MAACLCGRPSRAQIVDRLYPASVPGYEDPPGVNVSLRPLPDYDPLPLRIDGFLLRPQLDESVGYDSNVTGRDPGQDSAVIETQPRLAVNSDFGRNALGAAFSLDDERYLEADRQSRTDYTAALGGTYEIGRDALTLSGSHLSLHQDQTAINSAGLDRPLAFDVDDVRARYVTEVARWVFKPNVEYVRYRFDDVTAPGAQLSQVTRDRDTEAAGLTVDFAAIPERSAVLTLRALNTDFTGDYGGLARPNSQGYEALAGTDYAVSGNLRFVALAGYELRRFVSAAYRNRASPAVQASVIWTPTGLTTVSADASRTIEDAIGETTTGVTYTRANAAVDHEYQRNWLLHAGVGFEHAEYVGSSDESVYSAGVDATYLASRHLRLGVSYDFVARAGGRIEGGALSSASFGNSVVGDYTRNIVMLRVSLFP